MTVMGHCRADGLESAFGPRVARALSWTRVYRGGVIIGGFPVFTVHASPHCRCVTEVEAEAPGATGCLESSSQRPCLRLVVVGSKTSMASSPVGHVDPPQRNLSSFHLDWFHRDSPTADETQAEIHLSMPLSALSPGSRWAQSISSSQTSRNSEG